MRTRFHHIHLNDPRRTDATSVIYNVFGEACKWGAVKRHYHGIAPDLCGVTVCEIKEDDEVLSVGYAFCSSADQFSRKKGRAIAEGRARANLITEEVGQ